jgi:hypothetical protein
MCFADRYFVGSFSLNAQVNKFYVSHNNDKFPLFFTLIAKIEGKERHVMFYVSLPDAHDNPHHAGTISTSIHLNNSCLI